MHIILLFYITAVMSNIIFCNLALCLSLFLALLPCVPFSFLLIWFPLPLPPNPLTVFPFGVPYSPPL